MWKGAMVAAVALWTAPASAQVVDLLGGSAVERPADAQVDQQLGGEFGGMERVPLGMIQRAWDVGEEGQGIFRCQWARHRTCKVRAREGMVTGLVLPVWDRVADVVIGSSGVLREVAPDEAKAKGTGGERAVFLEPLVVGADTNVVVIGASGELYHFYVRAEGWNSATTSDGLVLVEGGAPGLVRPARAVPAVAVADGASLPPLRGVPDFADPATAAALNFRYVVKGSPDLAPDAVFDDGGRMYLYYHPDRWQAMDLPAVFRHVDGVDEPISVAEVVGTTLVVKEPPAELTLISGQRVTCIARSGPAA